MWGNDLILQYQLTKKCQRCRVIPTSIRLFLECKLGNILKPALKEGIVKKMVTNLIALLKQPHRPLNKNDWAKFHTERARRVRRIELPMKTHPNEVSNDRLIIVETEGGEYAIVVMPFREMVLKNIGPGTRVDVRYKKIGRDPIFGATITHIYEKKPEGVFCECSQHPKVTPKK